MSRLRLALTLGAAAGLSCMAVPLGLSAVQAHDLAPPQGARPGECYGKVILPPVYGAARRQELVHGGWVETRRLGAVVQRIPHRVLVRPASVQKFHTSPVYRTEVTWVAHQGPSHRVYEPARYEIVRDHVQIEAGHSEWRRTSLPLAYGETASGQTIVQPTGEIVCKVWVPARYEEVERKTLVSSGRSYVVAGPVRHERIVRRVLVSQGGWYERRIPAVYRTDYTERLIRPGHAERIVHGAVYRSVDSQTLIRPEREGWSRVMCGGAINPPFMARVQQALISQGFDPGPPDGAGRPETYAALRAFQRQHGLAQGQLTVETVQALGLM